MGDCSLLLKAEELSPLKSVPLARRGPRDELEATRAAIQVFLLVRHARNVLLRLPDDVRALARPAGSAGGALPPNAALRLPAAAQLLPCKLHMASRMEACRLLLYPADSAAAPSDAAAGTTKAGAPASAGDPPAAAPVDVTDATDDDVAPADGFAAARHLLVLVRPPPALSEAAAAEAAAAEAAAAGEKTISAQVVLSVPLSALSISVGGGGTRLLCRVPRHHAPPGGTDAPLALEFDELWRCSAAKSQLEAACTAARAEQHRKLVGMLRAGSRAA